MRLWVRIHSHCKQFFNPGLQNKINNIHSVWAIVIYSDSCKDDYDEEFISGVFTAPDYYYHYHYYWKLICDDSTELSTVRWGLGLCIWASKVFVFWLETNFFSTWINFSLATTIDQIKSLNQVYFLFHQQVPEE